MAAIYVRSTTGSNANSGATWALAKATLAGALAIAVAGDVIYVSQAHAESNAANVTNNWAGTRASPVQVICGNDAAQPPTALATSATATISTVNNWQNNGAALYVRGVTFVCSNSGGGSISFADNANDWARFESCGVSLLGSASPASGIFAGFTATSRTEFVNTSFKFLNAAHGIEVSGLVYINGGGAIVGTSTPTAFLRGYASSVPRGVLIENFDFSGFGNAMNVTAPPPQGCRVTLRNCKMPGGWSGTVVSGGWTNPGRVEMYGCGTGNNFNKIWIDDYSGTIKDEATLIKSGGSQDTSGLGYSLQMVSSANVSYPFAALAGPELYVWNTTTGASKTVTVDILRDSVTNLKDSEFWLEVEYMADTTDTLGALGNSETVPLATAADLAASSATWTTSGMANPNKQKATVTFTPQRRGFVIIRPMLGKASTTIYVDANPVIT